MLDRPDARPAARPVAGFVLLIALAALCAGGKAILHDTMDPDCFWHLRVADQLHREGIGPIVDHISFASLKTPWTPYSWLAELAMRAIWNFGDYRAAVVVQALMQSAIIAFMAMACVELQRQPQAGGEPRYFSAALATFTGGFLTLAFLSFRPVTTAFVLLWACTWLVLRDRRMNENSRAIWLLVPITALATNIHLFAFFIPAVVLAMLLGAIYERRVSTSMQASPTPDLQRTRDEPDASRAPQNPGRRSTSEPGVGVACELSRRIRRYLILLIAVSLAYLATPMLPGTMRTVMFYGARDEMVRNGRIAEMQFFARGGFGIASAITVAGIVACVIWHHRRLRLGEIICFIAGLALLFKYARFSPVFAMAAAPALAATLPRLRDEVLGKRLITAVMALVLVAGVVRVAMKLPRPNQTLCAWLGRHGPDAPSYPCSAADYVWNSVTPANGKIINEFGWGGYLGWRLQGRFQVLMDGRTQCFSSEFWHAVYLDGEDARRKYLAKLKVDAAILPAQKSQFHDALQSFGWISVYKDKQSEVMVPAPPRRTIPYREPPLAA